MVGSGRRSLGLFLAATSAMFATGCGLFGDPVQERWESRQEYPSCGDVKLRQGEWMEDEASAEIECLRQALDAGEGAELAISYPTAEGDPIREYYRLTPQGALEVNVDSTDDPNSDQNWSSADCSTPEWFPEISCPGPP